LYARSTRGGSVFCSVIAPGTTTSPSAALGTAAAALGFRLRLYRLEAPARRARRRVPEEGPPPDGRLGFGFGAACATTDGKGGGGSSVMVAVSGVDSARAWCRPATA
jgi:hypothetical protein